MVLFGLFGKCPFLRASSSHSLLATSPSALRSSCPFARALLPKSPFSFGVAAASRRFCSTAAASSHTIVLDPSAVREALLPLHPPLTSALPPPSCPAHDWLAQSPGASAESLYASFFHARLSQLRGSGEYRVFADMTRHCGDFPRARGRFLDREADRPAVMWCQNDYLGMGQHPRVLDATCDAVRAHGAGSGGTRNIAGTSRLHVELERELASWHGKDAALLFSSCYVANSAAIPTLVDTLGGPQQCALFSDEKNHASLVAGVRASRAAKHVFRHNDVGHLEELLAGAPRHLHKIIVFESVYSMDGTVAPIARVAALARRYGALTFLDEVHAVGMYGAQGGGVAERDGAAAEIDLISGTLGKAVGVYGGYIAAGAHIIDTLRSFSPGFIFTTSLPPAVTGAALASVRVLRGGEGVALREAHQAKVRKLKEELAVRGLPVMSTSSHIVPLIVGDARRCREMAGALLERFGVYVQPINAPSVKRGTERFRLTPTPLHGDQDIHYLANAFQTLFATMP